MVTPYNVAVADFLHAPDIDEIDVIVPVRKAKQIVKGDRIQQLCNEKTEQIKIAADIKSVLGAEISDKKIFLLASPSYYYLLGLKSLDPKKYGYSFYENYPPDTVLSQIISADYIILNNEHQESPGEDKLNQQLKVDIFKYLKLNNYEHWHSCQGISVWKKNIEQR